MMFPSIGFKNTPVINHESGDFCSNTQRQIKQILYTMGLPGVYFDSKFLLLQTHESFVKYRNDQE